MRTYAKAVLIGGSLALIAPAAGAQDYGMNTTPHAGDGAPPDNVIIKSPPIGRNLIAAPIVDLSLSRSIRTDDLDLRTDDGVRQLRSRVRATAAALCGWLNAMYPIDDEGGGWQWLQVSPCYRNAVKNAMNQADSAIRAARGYAGY